MNVLNEQAQIFMVAAICMALGCAALYFALAFWAMALDKALRIVGVHGAIWRWMQFRSHRKALWWRVGTWYERTFRGEEQR